MRRNGRDAPKPDVGHPLLERVEKRFCGFEVGRFEALGEPVVDRLEEGPRHQRNGPAAAG